MRVGSASDVEYEIFHVQFRRSSHNALLRDVVLDEHVHRHIDSLVLSVVRNGSQKGDQPLSPADMTSCMVCVQYLYIVSVYTCV